MKNIYEKYYDNVIISNVFTFIIVQNCTNKNIVPSIKL